mmetsp:Transcript_14034/g.26977  ORF Transcript_14034/g.26977 Transcript_14034/m.26977 type:complete len:270 (-) Transcript_14034:436-1245(-)
MTENSTGLLAALQPKKPPPLPLLLLPLPLPLPPPPLLFSSARDDASRICTWLVDGSCCMLPLGSSVPPGPGGGPSPPGGGSVYTWSPRTKGVGAESLVISIPKPSIMARIIPPKAPLTSTSFGPLLIAKTPPVSAPAAIEFHGSSFFLIPTRMQSKVLKSPPQTAKLPPSRGDSLRMASSAPFTLAPGGEFLSPLTRYQTPPPTAPIPNALPQSSKILCGQGSRPWSTGPLAITNLSYSLSLYLSLSLSCSFYWTAPPCVGGGSAGIRH